MKIIALNLSQTAPIMFLDVDSQSNSALGELAQSGLRGLLDPSEGRSPIELLRSAIAIADGQSIFASIEYLEVADLLTKDAILLGIDVPLDNSSDSITAILEAIDGEAIVVAFSAIDPDGARAFLLTTTQGLVSARLDNTRVDDLIATVLELAGIDRPSDGLLENARSLAFLLGDSDGTLDDDEELVRERLRGLGYIA